MCICCTQVFISLTLPWFAQVIETGVPNKSLRVLFFDNEKLEANTVQMLFSSSGFTAFHGKLQRSGETFIRRYVERCSIIWSRRVPKSVYKFLKAGQRVNHTPGRHLLGHKDSLAVITNACIEKYGKGRCYLRRSACLCRISRYELNCARPRL